MNCHAIFDSVVASGWIYETIFDGYRALAYKTGRKVRLVSRNQKSFNDNYPQLVSAVKSLSAENAIIDGEIAALDESGRSSFQLLQNYGSDQKSPIVYYGFDLLSLEGTDLRSRPLVKRRAPGRAPKECACRYPIFRGAAWQ
jgi:bifunctional non-homologous end joining protein LigD